MNNIDFEVNQDLFKNKTTDDKYVVSVKKNKANEIDVTFLEIDENGIVKNETFNYADSYMNRQLIKNEINNTLLKIIELNNWKNACYIYDLGGKLYDIKLEKNINFILSTVGLSSALVLGKGISLLQMSDSSGTYLILIGSMLMFVSIKVASNYFKLHQRYSEVKDEIENTIQEEGYKLIRKK